MSLSLRLPDGLSSLFTRLPVNLLRFLDLAEKYPLDKCMKCCYNISMSTTDILRKYLKDYMGDLDPGVWVTMSVDFQVTSDGEIEIDNLDFQLSEHQLNDDLTNAPNAAII